MGSSVRRRGFQKHRPAIRSRITRRCSGRSPFLASLGRALAAERQVVGQTGVIRMDDGDHPIRSTAAFAHLRTLGRVTGSLTYEDVDRHLPKSVTSSTEIEAWLSELSDDGIDIAGSTAKS